MEESQPELTLVEHLIELRQRLVKASLAVLAVFAGLFPFAGELYTLAAAPLMRQLPEHAGMIATGVVSPFLTPFKFAFFLALFVAMPFVLHQAWAFVSPGLYRHERALALPLLISSIVLFYAGAAFAYFVVFPLVFGFITAVAPEGIAVTPDISSYLDFAIKMFLAFGAAFEVPVVTVLLVLSGVTSRQRLVEMRPYIIVGAFVVGMLLTPPDAVSQVMLAVPMWCLFEVGLLFCRLIEARRGSADAVNSGPSG